MSDGGGTRVYVVDDNRPFLESTGWLLQTFGFKASTFDGGAALLAEFDASPPPAGACLVSDIRMPGMSGLQLLDALRRVGHSIPVIFITGHGDVPLAVEAMRKGAANFIEKPFPEQALADAIEAAVKTRPGGEGGGCPASLLAKLSPRERQVLDLVVASKPNKIIADVLGISIKTVELHRANMKRKLGVKSLPELMKLVLGA